MNHGDGCKVDGHTEDRYGGEHYWHCGSPGTIEVDGMLMCEDHAGERGYGPKQEEYGFDPHDGLNPTRDLELDRPCPTCSAVAGEDCHGFGYCPARSAPEPAPKEG